VAPDQERHDAREALREPEEADLGASGLRKMSKPDPLIGRTVGGRYTIVSRIGAGGMGVVYKARQGAVDRDIAVKVLLPDRLNSDDDLDETVRRFHLEARAASKLSHPNTITIYDFGQDEDGLLYIAMEYLQGNSLEQVLRQGPMEPGRVARVMMQICSSLAEAHKKGIIHRDIKPDNMFLIQMGDQQDFVKVLDFGVAKLRGPAQEKTLTRAGMIFGTPKYMSPEQARCQSLDARSDIYSLGVMMYQMLIGRVPFDADDHVSILLMHCTDPPPPFDAVRQDVTVPEELAEVVFKALQKDRDRRFQAVEEMQSALEVVAARFNYVTATGLLPTVSPSVLASLSPSGAPTPAPLDTLNGGQGLHHTPSPGALSTATSAPDWAGQLTLGEPPTTPLREPERPTGPPLPALIGGAALVVLLIIGAIAFFISQKDDPAPPQDPAPEAKDNTPSPQPLVAADPDAGAPTPDAAEAQPDAAVAEADASPQPDVDPAGPSAPAPDADLTPPPDKTPPPVEPRVKVNPNTQPRDNGKIVTPKDDKTTPPKDKIKPKDDLPDNPWDEN
jgi:serine/threonine-protein kinase